MPPKYQRDLGKRTERQARDECRVYWNADDCERAAQTSGKLSADLHRALYRAYVEVKGRKSHAVVGWLRRAEKDADRADVPILLLREHGDPRFVVCFRMTYTFRFVARYLANLRRFEPQEFEAVLEMSDGFWNAMDSEWGSP